MACGGRVRRLVGTPALVAVFLGAPAPVLAQVTTSLRSRAAKPAPPSTPEPATPWTIGLSVTGNFFPKGTQADFVQPTVTVDHGWLHLEARYAYEALDTGSVWIGWNLSWGDALTFSLTPMFGVVFGAVKGVAPGVEWDLTWGPLELTSTGELVLDFANGNQSDFNYWAEARVWPWKWLKLGVALTRTRAIQTVSPEQWGPLVGVNFWKIDFALYWMNPGHSTDEYASATLTFSF